MSREAFEKWADVNFSLDILRGNSFNGLTLRTAIWEAWQACAEEKDKRIAELTEQNKELVEALKFYADKKNWHKDSQQYGSFEVSDYNIIYNDFYEKNQAIRYAGKVAVEALAKVKGE